VGVVGLLVRLLPKIFKLHRFFLSDGGIGGGLTFTGGDTRNLGDLGEEERRFKLKPKGLVFPPWDGGWWSCDEEDEKGGCDVLL
jgi:hypothetical protein